MVYFGVAIKNAFMLKRSSISSCHAINSLTNHQYQITIYAWPHYHPHYHPRETAKLVSNPGELTGRAAVYGMAQKIPQYHLIPPPLSCNKHKSYNLPHGYGMAQYCTIPPPLPLSLCHIIRCKHQIYHLQVTCGWVSCRLSGLALQHPWTNLVLYNTDPPYVAKYPILDVPDIIHEAGKTLVSNIFSV